tara:strand:+ start:2329 stop:3456 length:1128 start_codon:yes stop_codon:yes gene_type:complete
MLMVEGKILKDTDELVFMEPMNDFERDTRSLCGARHRVQIGITEGFGENQELKPFEDYIIVYFAPQDTGGGGQLMNMLTDGLLLAKDVVVGGSTIFHDDEHYRDVMQEGRDAAQDKYNECVAEHGRWACTGVLAETGAYTGLSAVGSGVSYVAGGAYDIAEAVWCLGPWCAETDYSLYAEQNERRTAAKSPFYTPFAAETKEFAYEWGDTGNESTNCNSTWLELTGGCYHAMSGGTHKIRIEITNTFNGQTITKYDSELAGCNADYEEGSACRLGEAYTRFLINAPGTWTVKVTPMATAACNSLDYTATATYEVPEPEDWEPSELFTLSQNASVALQDAGIPIAVTPTKIVLAASLVGGLLFFKIWKKKQAKKEE